MIRKRNALSPVRVVFRWKRIAVTIHANRLPGGGYEITLVSLQNNTRAALSGAVSAGCQYPFVRRIRRFLDGEERDLSDMPICIKGFTPFRRKATEAARRIPWGTTVSYAGLACMAGFPSAARAVASVMRRNPFPLIVPCHRVICADGKIGGFAGKISGKQIEIKRMLLRREGVRV